MTDISLENTKSRLVELGYTEQEDGTWVCPAHPAKTPGVGIIPQARVTILDEVVTTYVGHVGNGYAGNLPLDPKDYHRVYSVAFEKDFPNDSSNCTN